MHGRRLARKEKAPRGPRPKPRVHPAREVGRRGGGPRPPRAPRLDVSEEAREVVLRRELPESVLERVLHVPALVEDLRVPPPAADVLPEQVLVERHRPRVPRKEDVRPVRVEREAVERHAPAEAPGPVRRLEDLRVPEAGGEGDAGEAAPHDADHVPLERTGVLRPSRAHAATIPSYTGSCRRGHAATENARAVSLAASFISSRRSRDIRTALAASRGLSGLKRYPFRPCSTNSGIAREFAPATGFPEDSASRTTSPWVSNFEAIANVSHAA